MMKLVLSATVAVAIGVICEILLYNQYSAGESKFSIDLDYINWVRPIMLFVIMLAGNVMSTIHERLKPADVVRSEYFRFWESATLWRGVLVAPIIFYAIYQQTSNIPDDITAAVLAFENGFFWEKVLASKKGLNRNSHT